MSELNGGGKKKNTWPDERVALLIKLWKEGLSAAQIAARLGNGITRNAVIGKLYRLGLSGRGKPATVSKPRPRRAATPRKTQARTAGNTALKAEPAPAVARPKPQRKPVAIKLADIPQGERVTLLMLRENSCRWPSGDPGTESFTFCGRESRPDGPYCTDHAQIAYQPADRRRR